uniref:CSON009781 protein n=1 Tax=Culicoides sonorensis TaxID=179676 RepID=A0A336M4M9_CULSO
MLIDYIKKILSFLINLILLPQKLINDLVKLNWTTLGIEYLPEKNQIKLKCALEELLKTEENYVNKLDFGLKSYAEPLDELLQDKYNEEFFDIERLKNFHKYELLPLIRDNQRNVFDIANTFHRLISNDCFFDYVFYAMRKPKLENFIAEHSGLFEKLALKSNDKLGINSFLHEPIQRIPRYKLLFTEIIKAISVDDDAMKDIQRACHIAERDILTLLNTVNEALNLNLLNKTDQFNMFEYGKFIKASDFEMIDTKQNIHFKGKAFLFEKALLCTEFDELKVLYYYRTHILIDDILYIDADKQGTFRINLDDVEIDFTSNKEIIEKWIDLLTRTDNRNSSVLGSSTWDEKQYLKILRKIERHYILHLNLYKQNHLFEAKALQDLSDLISLTDTLYIFHVQKILPVLEKPNICITEVCELFKTCLSDPTFEIYKKYGVLAPTSFKSSKSNFKSLSDLENFHKFIELPLNHLSRYKKFFSKMVRVLFNDTEVPKDLVLKVASVQVEINKYEKTVMDHYKLHSIESNNVAGVQDLGMINYTDFVTFDNMTSKNRIFLMDDSVLAVKLKTLRKDDENEIFESFLWRIPLEGINIKISSKINKKLKISSKTIKSGDHSVTFRTIEKMKEFVKYLDSKTKAYEI